MSKEPPTFEITPKRAKGAAAPEVVFSQHFVTCFYATLLKGNEQNMKLDLGYMSSLTAGTLNLTAESIQHKLRAVKKGAKELNAEMSKMIEAGNVPVVMTKFKTGGDTKKNAATNDDNTDNNTPTPTPLAGKKRKTVAPPKRAKKVKVKNEPVSGDDSSGDTEIDEDGPAAR